MGGGVKGPGNSEGEGGGRGEIHVQVVGNRLTHDHFIYSRRCHLPTFMGCSEVLSS